jgi:hypothetical protein
MLNNFKTLKNIAKSALCIGLFASSTAFAVPVPTGTLDLGYDDFFGCGGHCGAINVTSGSATFRGDGTGSLAINLKKHNQTTTQTFNLAGGEYLGENKNGKATWGFDTDPSWFRVFGVEFDLKMNGLLKLTHLNGDDYKISLWAHGKGDYHHSGTLTYTPVDVSEPAIFGMFFLGAFGLAAARKRKTA